jgi:hypothetical protein
LLSVPARRFHLAGYGAGDSSNRGRLDHGDRGLPAGSFRDVRAADDDDDGSRAGDELMSLIYSMLMSVDRYVEEEHGGFGCAAPDEEVPSCIL